MGEMLASGEVDGGTSLFESLYNKYLKLQNIQVIKLIKWLHICLSPKFISQIGQRVEMLILKRTETKQNLRETLLFKLY